MTSVLLKAAKVIRRDFNEIEKLQNSKLGTDKFVANSLKNIEDLISLDLAKARPGWKISFIEDNKIQLERLISDDCFVVKPISGIKNFSSGISYFATSIALINKKDIIASVIYDPIKDEMFCSEKGKGAFINNSRIRVSSNREILNSILAFEEINLIKSFFEDNKKIKYFGNIRVYGSTCLDLANTASGKIDCYCSSYLNNYTNSAGLLLVKESGGIKIDFNNFDNSILTNSNLAETIQKIYE